MAANPDQPREANGEYSFVPGAGASGIQGNVLGDGLVESDKIATPEPSSEPNRLGLANQGAGNMLAFESATPKPKPVRQSTLDLLDERVKSRNEKEMLWVARHKDAQSRHIDALVNTYRRDWASLHAAGIAASNPNMSDETADQLLDEACSKSYPSNKVREFLAHNTRLSADDIIRVYSIAKPSELSSGFLVLENPNCPESILLDAAKNGPIYQRHAVSTRKHLSVEVQKVLYKDSQATVRSNLARCKNLDAEVEKALRNDKTATVRAAMLKHRPTKTAIAEAAVSSSIKMRRLAAARTSDEKTADNLCMDENANVRNTAKRNKAATDAGRVFATLME